MLFALFLIAAPSPAELSAVIEYEAAPECASSEAFRAQIRAQLTDSAAHAEARRFSIRIRHGEEFVGTITSNGHVREVHASSCDEVAAALAMIVAMAIPPQDEEPPAPALPVPPNAPPQITPQPASTPAAKNEVESDPRTVWRLAVRFQDWTNNAWLHTYGPALMTSVERRWGGYRMQFEFGLTAGFSPTIHQPGQFIDDGHADLTAIDVEVCPLDFRLGSGFSVLGCASTAIGVIGAGAAIGNDVANWLLLFGANGRLRWQSEARIFLEARIGALYGTQSFPLYDSPAWLDWGGSVGLRL